jgi:hypothetical protein
MELRPPPGISSSIGRQLTRERRQSRRTAASTTLNALARRIDELEHVASSQGRELRIQFERLAQLQAEYDILRIRSGKP